jgi:hypothetical protein
MSKISLVSWEGHRIKCFEAEGARRRKSSSGSLCPCGGRIEFIAAA